MVTLFSCITAWLRLFISLTPQWCSKDAWMIFLQQCRLWDTRQVRTSIQCYAFLPLCWELPPLSYKTPLTLAERRMILSTDGNSNLKERPRIPQGHTVFPAALLQHCNEPARAPTAGPFCAESDSVGSWTWVLSGVQLITCTKWLRFSQASASRI